MANITRVLLLMCVVFEGCFCRTIPNGSNNERKLIKDSPRYFEDHFNATIECIRKYLTQGDTDTGIPPMDPLKFLEMKRLNIDNKYLWTNMKLFGLVIKGLMSFETQSLNLSSLMKLDVDYYYEKIHLSTAYDGQINLLSMITFDGKGTIDVELSDVHIKTSTQYNIEPPLIDDYTLLLSMKKAKITITGMMNEEWSRFFSIIFSRVATELVNTFQTEISATISPYVMEYYNSRVGHLAFLDFLAMISDLTCPV